MKKFSCYPLILAFILICPKFAWAQTPNPFETKHAVVFYAAPKDLDDFIWRLGGQRLDFTTETHVAVNRIDRLVERVQAILDMWPQNFKVTLYLDHGILQEQKVAYYDKKTGAIHISVDYTSDGVLAHEIAHALIYAYFPSPPAAKVQEILAQYVDNQLWSDYY